MRGRRACCLSPGTPLATHAAVVRLLFDRGTLLLTSPPATLEPAALASLPEVRWDPRVLAHRAPAHRAYAIASDFRRRGVSLSEAPRPTLGPPSAFRPPSAGGPDLQLRPYQDAALAAWRLAGRRGLIVLPTGSGKTHVALAAIAATRAPCLCLVPTRALLAQWLATLAAVYDGPIGRFGDGERILAPLTVATFAGAYRHMARIGNRFGLLIVDEAHHFGHGTQDEALEMSIAPLRLGLTATPPEPGPAATRLATLVGPVVVRAVDRRSRRPLPRATRAHHLAPRARRGRAPRIRRAAGGLSPRLGRVSSGTT